MGINFTFLFIIASGPYCVIGPANFCQPLWACNEVETSFFINLQVETSVRCFYRTGRAIDKLASSNSSSENEKDFLFRPPAGGSIKKSFLSKEILSNQKREMNHSILCVSTNFRLLLGEHGNCILKDSIINDVTRNCKILLKRETFVISRREVTGRIWFLKLFKLTISNSFEMLVKFEILVNQQLSQLLGLRWSISFAVHLFICWNFSSIFF